MHEFVILIVGLVAVAGMQKGLSFAYTQFGLENLTPVSKVACEIFSWALLVRFVYNQFATELMAFLDSVL